ncbi:benzoate/H(+) symporter BenE family transporter [Cedecea davisae]|uniref:Benzoate/H(+) symporter BenE family transporter n=1 Tax=Cedecea davisae TaxID=158484 RepID=A0ABS6DJY1_9ENTR|nr:benzoate/H(+) symporter BenE family transporter [Cedecea davisae]MBU4683525.1 benzoate/H(+) symporter BenE family transporter [Cedecea davisae]MBU4685275.1 benzoate/H(+) symporter BenE family transporter [Cedecea davisae]
MRLSFPPLPTVLAGFVAVLVGYASSAAIIWQAADAAGANAHQIAGWLTMLGIAMGVSTLALTLWYRVPVLTAWSTPGAALLATSLPGTSLNEAVGVFIFASLLILLCGATGLFARLMRVIPPTLSAAMLAGVLLRFGLEAFTSLQGHFLLSSCMFLAWLLAKVFAPRYAVVAAMLVGLAVCLVGGEINANAVPVSLVIPEFTAPAFSFTSLLGIGVPFFLVTMASQNAPGVATLKASGYNIPVSPLMVVTAAIALLLAPFGVFSVCIAAITAAICQSGEAHPDKDKRWMAAAAAGVFYLIAGIFGGSISALLTALPLAWIHTLAGLALLGTIAGSLHQALSHERERDAAIVTFLVTASGVNLLGVSSAFWGLVAGGVSYTAFSLFKRA